MTFDEERKKLFDEVWKEPMTTVAKRYELSDNGLRKRCIKLEIPLPPAGYWAKVQAGKPVPAQPELPPYKALSVQKEASGIYKKSNMGLELIDMSDQSSEQLKELDGLDLLAPESKERLLKWCKKIEVPKRIAQYNPLIVDYQAEMEYRKKRDEEHRFRDVFRFSMYLMYEKPKIQYRKNKAVLPISVSNKHANRAFRIIDTLIKLVGDWDGTVAVRSGEEDNASFRLFGHVFSFQLTESMVKRRSLLSSLSPEKAPTDFKPMYEKVFSGRFKIEFTEILDYSHKDKTPKAFKFEDSVDNPIENQMGDIFIVLCQTANEAAIIDIIAKREMKLKEIEQKRLQEIEGEKRRRLLQIEEQNRRKQNLIHNIENQMEGWFKSQKLLKYAEELEAFASDTNDETVREPLSTYIKLVRQKAEKCDPVKVILTEVKAIITKSLTDKVHSPVKDDEE